MLVGGGASSIRSRIGVTLGRDAWGRLAEERHLHPCGAHHRCRWATPGKIGIFYYISSTVLLGLWNEIKSAEWNREWERDKEQECD